MASKRKSTNEYTKTWLDGISNMNKQQSQEVKPNGFSEKDLEKMHSMTVTELANRLEDDLLNSCRVDEEMTVYEYIRMISYK